MLNRELKYEKTVFAFENSSFIVYNTRIRSIYSLCKLYKKSHFKSFMIDKKEKIEKNSKKSKKLLDFSKTL